MSNLKSKIHTCREKLAISIEMLQEGDHSKVINILCEVSNTLNDMYPEINIYKEHINRLTSKL